MVVKLVNRYAMDTPEPILEGEKITRFSNDIRKVINYYQSEYHMTYAAMVGVLFGFTHDVAAEWSANVRDVDDDEDDQPKIK